MTIYDMSDSETFEFRRHQEAVFEYVFTQVPPVMRPMILATSLANAVVVNRNVSPNQHPTTVENLAAGLIDLCTQVLDETIEFNCPCGDDCKYCDNGLLGLKALVAYAYDKMIPKTASFQDRAIQLASILDVYRRQ